MHKNIRLLIVEDSEDDAILLRRELEHNGYVLTSERVDTAPAMKAALEKQEWEIIVSDFIMPNFSGMDSLKMARELAPETPFVLLSGKAGEDIAVTAMKAGASDYIMKGDLKRIVPAVERELREAENRRERRRAEQKLKTSEKVYRLLADNVSDVIWTADMNLRFAYVSPSVARLRGYAAEETMGQGLKGVLTPDSFKAVRSAFTKILADAARDKEVLSIPHLVELEIIRKDGSTVWTETKWSFLVNTDGSPGGILGVSRDITERRKAEKKLRQEQEERLQAYERLAYLGRLAGSIAHELRNPLATIDSSAHYLTLALKDVDDKSRAHLVRINAAVRRSADVIQSLLDQARMKEPVRTRLDLVSATSEIVDGCEIPRGVKVIKNGPQCELMVEADKGQIGMVFQNIIKNAVEAMGEHGTLTIAVRNLGDEAEVSFADTGTGIAEEHVEKIFQPLFTTKVTGIGFGLSIAKAIVDLHGGLIEARSGTDKGAVFSVKLPLCKEKKRP